MSKRRNNNSKNVKLHSYIKMQIINVIVFFVIFMITALVCVATDIGVNSMLYISAAFIGISSFISGVIAGMKERKKGIICGIINVLPLNMILLIISLALNSFKADISLLIIFLAGIIAAATGGIVAVNIRIK